MKIIPEYEPPLKELELLTNEEKKMLLETPVQELLRSGEWVKLYDLSPSLKLYDYTGIQKEGDKLDKV